MKGLPDEVQPPRDRDNSREKGEKPMERQEKIDTLKMFAGFPKLVRLGVAAGKALSDLAAQAQKDQPEKPPTHQKPA